MKFYTTTTNSRGTTIKAGAHRGQFTHSRTWNLGVKVIASLDENKKAIFEIWQTGGTNNNKATKLIKILREK